MLHAYVQHMHASMLLRTHTHTYTLRMHTPYASADFRPRRTCRPLLLAKQKGRHASLHTWQLRCHPFCFARSMTRHMPAHERYAYVVDPVLSDGGRVDDANHLPKGALEYYRSAKTVTFEILRAAQARTRRSHFANAAHTGGRSPY